LHLSEGKVIRNEKCCQAGFLVHPMSVNEQDSKADMLMFDTQALPCSSVLKEMQED